MSPGPILDDEPSPDELGDDAAPAAGGSTSSWRGPNAGTGAVALDLSPRTSGTGPGDRGHGSGGAVRPNGRRWPWLVVLAVIVVGVGFVISRALTDATQFYLAADEAVARQGELGSRTFRLEGTVVEGSTRPTPAGVDFKLASGGVEVEVHHSGAPQALFQPCIPVVVEGHWQQGVFTSDEMIVAHDEQYEEQNSQRIEQAKAAGAQSNACAQRDAVAAAK